MELTHSFEVPVPVDTAWDAFLDIASVAECFPGAAVTGVEGDQFTGTCKVKLGPIALVYGGSGTFVKKDEAARTLVLEAKGKDKRGNGTAGATVTAVFAETSAGTKVDVLTELQITGKPAQFGRGVMQDVSDKLLGEFVACLQQRLVPAPVAAIETEADTHEEGDAVADMVAEGGSQAAPEQEQLIEPAPAKAEAIDLGATVLPILLKSYWKQFAAGVVALIVLRWLWGRRDGR